MCDYFYNHTKFFHNHKKFGGIMEKNDTKFRELVLGFHEMPGL